MTVLTKPSLTIKKTPLIDESFCDEEIIEMHAVPAGKRHGLAAMMCMGVTLFLLVLLGVITALQLYDQFTLEASVRNHYQGFCSIPRAKTLPILDRSSITWKVTPYVKRVEPEVQVVSLLEEDPEHLMDLLREVLDIDIDDSVEKISVFNNGHPVSFIHDFESNVTGIVDTMRCFTMELDPRLVLQPEQFVWGLQRGEQFDVSRVRTQLVAALPAGGARDAASARALQACAGKPVYRLHKDTAVAIRKRSADAPPHDYMQFAGNRIQEIEISNLAELLEYEQNIKQDA